MVHCIVCNSLFDETSIKESSPRCSGECMDCYRENTTKRYLVEFTAKIEVEAKDEEEAEELAQANLTGAEMETNITEIEE